MKQETKELIEWAKEQFGIMKACEYTWKKPDDKEKCKRMSEFLDCIPEMEKNLANGGLVKDSKGNWLKSGTKVKYIRHNADGDWHTGIVYFGNENLCWYLNTEEGDWLYLAHDYLEVDTFEKFDDCGIDKFVCGTAQISMIKENLYSVAISSADGKQIAKFKVDDRLDDTWQGFKVGDEEYDINIYSSELYGTDDDAKWGATVYPVRNGSTDTQIMAQLKVEEV